MATETREGFIFILIAQKVKDLPESTPLKLRDGQEIIQHHFIRTFHPATRPCATG